MYAGLQASIGEYCVLMDADLQHPPALLPAMFSALQKEGYDCCAGRRTTRRGRRHPAEFPVPQLLHCDLQMQPYGYAGRRRGFPDDDPESSGLILSCREYNRYMKGIFSFVGFETKWIPYENAERAAGNTKWNLRKLFCYALNGIFSFSTTPITLAGVAGAILFLLSLIYGGITAIGTIFSEMQSTDGPLSSA